MSVWEESEDDQQRLNLSSMTDVSFKIDCTSLPVDHATALSESLCRQQPWIAELDHTGIHSIHVAGSQNGWQRPETDDEVLLLSKRTRLKIRINTSQADRLIENLKESTHSIGDHHLKILDGRISPLKPAITLFSRHTVYLQDQATSNDEQNLVQHVINECENLGYTPTKVLCGRTNSMATTSGALSVRSLLLADVPAEISMILQDKGLGDLRIAGCGIMIPHKDTGAVS